MTERPVQRARINWRQAAGEAVILLAGVLLALAGQAWWEARAEHRAAREHVENLLVELQTNIVGLDIIIGSHDKRIDDAVELIRLLAADDPPADAKAIRAPLGRIMFFDDFLPGTSALENLLSAGDAGLLSSTDLQLAVSRYSQALKAHNVLQSELADFFLNRFSELAGALMPLLDVGYVGRGIDIPQSRFTFDPAAIRGSMAFENMLARRISAERDAKDFAERLRDRSAELIALLESLD